MNLWDKILQKPKQNSVRYVIVMLITVAILLTFIPLTPFAMQVFVRVHVDLDMGNITLEVEQTDRIEDIKQKIADKNAIPAEDQILIFAGNVLENGNTLQDYTVPKDAKGCTAV